MKSRKDWSRTALVYNRPARRCRLAGPRARDGLGEPRQENLPLRTGEFSLLPCGTQCV